MSRLKLFIPFFVFLFLGLMLWFALPKVDPTDLPSTLEGRPVPNFQMGTVKDLDELKTQNDIRSSDYSVINVWATWCGPCRQEHPFLIDLANSGVAIYGVNANDDLGAAQAWLDQRGDPYQFSVYDPGGALAVDLGTTAYPETFLVDNNGMILKARRGLISPSVWEQEFQPYIDELLASNDKNSESVVLE